jgi:hypothetical protein
MRQRNKQNLEKVARRLMLWPDNSYCENGEIEGVLLRSEGTVVKQNGW